MIAYALLAAIINADHGSADVLKVQKWEPQDFVFHSENDNPFAVAFSASVRQPDGREFNMPGFYDGDGTWKIRISMNTEGMWSIFTHSDDPCLDGKSLSIECSGEDPKLHGSLNIDRENPYHFVYEDGARYFMMGYECDWLWALDLSELNPFLDKLADYGFNNIILNAYAHDTSWCKGKTSDKDYGPPPMYAWHGDNDNPIHSRFNLEYWKHYDSVIDALYRRGITAHIMIKVYNKMVEWPEKGSAEDDMYFRWLIARYAAYPNVIWDFSKEANNEKDLDYKLDRFRFIRENDPYKRLMTNHDDKATYDTGVYNRILDFRSDQQHSDWHEKILRQREQNSWPVVNVEFGYEHGKNGLEDKTYGVAQSPEEVCRRAWEICMAGGYVAYYYTYTAWDIIISEDTPVGYGYFKNLRDFFENTQYWLMKPSDRLMSDGYCLANEGKEYIVYHNKPKPFKINIKKASTGRWFNPFTGKYTEPVDIIKKTEIIPPADWGDAPAVFHINEL